MGDPVALSKLKLSSELVTCTNCHSNVITMVNTKFSCINFCCCCCTCLIFWVCFQLCRNKALICQDADHICPKCGTLIAHYEAC